MIKLKELRILVLMCLFISSVMFVACPNNYKPKEEPKQSNEPKPNEESKYIFIKKVTLDGILCHKGKLGSG